jgi:hypothetical protein
MIASRSEPVYDQFSQDCQLRADPRGSALAAVNLLRLTGSVGLGGQRARPVSLVQCPTEVHYAARRPAADGGGTDSVAPTDRMVRGPRDRHRGRDVHGALLRLDCRAALHPLPRAACLMHPTREPLPPLEPLPPAEATAPQTQPECKRWAAIVGLYQRARSGTRGSCPAGGSLTRCGEPREGRHGCADRCARGFRRSGAEEAR